jgi:hypothetical protein
MKVPIEVVIKDEEIAIYIDRKMFLGWLRDVPGALDGESPIPWDGDETAEQTKARMEKQTVQAEVDKKAEELRILHEKNQGFKDSEGETKEFPNPVPPAGTDSTGPTIAGGEIDGDDMSGAHVADRDIGEEPDSINLFDEGPNGIGGTLQDDPKAKDKMKAMKDWLKAEKFNYKNFCVYLLQIKEVAGFKLFNPLIGLTQKKEPSMFQLATRYYSYWMSAKTEIRNDYQSFLIKQLQDLGITIADAKGNVLAVFDGSEEIDPKNLPKGVEVGV